MGPELIQTVMMVTGAGVVASTVLLLVRFRQQTRLASWQAAVTHAGLTQVETQDRFIGAAVTARDGDLVVRLETYRRGKHENGTRLTIRSLSRSSGSLTVRSEGLATALDKRLLGARESEIGEESFDRECFVQGPPALAMATLTEPLRRDVARLVHGSLLSSDGSWIAVRGSLSDGVLKVDLRERFFAARDQVSDVLAAALRIARGLNPPADVATRLVVNLGQERHPWVRARLVETLAREFPSHPKTAQALRDACSDDNDEVRLRAAVATPVEGRRTLLELVSSDATADGLRARAIAALGSAFPADLAEATLRRVLDAKEPATARACIEALRELRQPGSETLLLKALDLADEAVGVAAARALRLCGGVGAVARLLEVARDGASSELRQAARQAVGAIQSRLPGAAPGQLALADGGSGGLSLADETPAGQLSLADAPGAESAAAEPQATERSPDETQPIADGPEEDARPGPPPDRTAQRQ